MVVVFVIVALGVLCLLAGAHWYLWRRLVRDVSAKGGGWRRTGKVLVFALPGTVVATMITTRAGAPFPVQRVLAWPGYLWLALLLYLLLALLVGEAVRPLLRWALSRRAPERRVDDASAGTA
ncbi:MAG: metallophosphoesterase, partial [Streptomyces sp.]